MKIRETETFTSKYYGMFLDTLQVIKIIPMKKSEFFFLDYGFVNSFEISRVVSLSFPDSLTFWSNF